MAGGGFMLLLVAGAVYLVGTLVGIEALLFPARLAMGVGVVWFVAARLARVGRSL